PDYDVLIIGSGLAGQSAALRLAGHGRILLICKRALEESASSRAQGGIAAVLDDQDSIKAHIEDTFIAGAYLNDARATRFVVENGREAIEWLIEEGVPFTKDQFGYHLTREGGHSARRIIHVADATGFAVQETLTKKVRQHPGIEILEDHIAIDFITGSKLGLAENRCYGAYVLDSRSGAIKTISARHTLIASGGAGKVYRYTTNPDTSTGDGIAMAWRAGCKIANMEFIQFHPTCLYHPLEKSFLISEAVRGEGGILQLPDGTRFMPMHDERAELAPRDVVARAIDFEMKKHGLDCVFLDISHKGRAFVLEHFPNIHARCLALGIDITREPIPVVPAAHYTCGGIVTDLKGRTGLPGLYAVGESSCSGLHGANRLASNSLLECLVFSKSATEDILAAPVLPFPDLPEWDESRVTDADEEVVIAHNWDELRHFMWDYVGIVRTTKRLKRALHRVRLLKREIDEFYANFRISHDLIELRNLVVTAELIIRSALKRKESRGLHFSRDYPELLPRAKNTVLQMKKRKPRAS
ncbi:MAG: L-aspartate oxidase, partial [Zoogloeaceae bacterium]|nr:L-aspartate oxidase [Zoogloeaceae bacterium]